MTQNIGTLVAAQIKPEDSADTYPTHEDTYGKGGYVSVADVAARDAITTERRKAGMLVKVAGDPLLYQLEDDLDTWTPLSTENLNNFAPGVYEAVKGILAAGNNIEITSDDETGVITVTGHNVTVDIFEPAGSYTWTKRAGAISVKAMLLGPGGGAGGGYSRGGGNEYGAGAGGGGSYAEGDFLASELPDTVAITVGAGGPGGAPGAEGGADAQAGGVGTATTFGAYLTAYPGGGGNGAGPTTGNGNGGSGAGIYGAGSTSTTSSAAPGGTFGGGDGGQGVSGTVGKDAGNQWAGAGGGACASNQVGATGGKAVKGGPGGGAGSAGYSSGARNGGAGQRSLEVSAIPSGGVVDTNGGHGADGVTPTASFGAGSSGAGGASSQTSTGGNGGNGGRGAGGGGAGSTDSAARTSGIGGKGGDGIAVVITYS